MAAWYVYQLCTRRWSQPYRGQSAVGGCGRQVDGEALEIKTGTDGAAPFGGMQDLERKQDEAPECSSRRVEMVTGCIFYDRASSKVRESPDSSQETVPESGSPALWGSSALLVI